MNGWTSDLIVVRDGSHSSGERSSLQRDVEHGRLLRIRKGVYIDRPAFVALSVEDQHVVRIRAVEATSVEPVVFSHFSAAVLHGLPVLAARLDRVHTTARDAPSRTAAGGHVFRLVREEVVRFGPIFATSLGRTVVDVAGAAPLGEGLMVADAVLRAGHPRALLQQAADVVGPRNAQRRIADVVAAAHPGAEGANESMSRAGMIRLGYWPPELQHPLWDADGFVAWLDFFFTRFRVGGEADGLRKFLDPSMAPRGAGMAVYREKKREDRALPLLDGLARWGWPEAVNPDRLRIKLASVGVHPEHPRATIGDYAAAARDARPRPPVAAR